MFKSKVVLVGAVFVGQDGSLGYKSNTRYELRISTNSVGQIDVRLEKNVGADGALPQVPVQYDSVVGFLSNWSDIEEGLVVTEDRELTFGEKAAGISFNPGNMKPVDDIKRISAYFIDFAHNKRGGLPRGEAARYLSTAITYMEIAQMEVVKALTWQHDAPVEQQQGECKK